MQGKQISDPAKKYFDIAIPIALLPYRDLKPRNKTGVVRLLPEARTTQLNVGEETSISSRIQFFSYFYILKIIGRFPVRVVRLLLHGTPSSIVFSNMPFTTELGTIQGQLVNGVGSWPCCTGATGQY